MKKVQIIIGGLLLAIATLTLSFKDDLFQISKNLDLFASLYKEININYVEETNPADLMKTGIDAMLSSLDPYTEYVPESEIENYKLKYVSTQYGGIGAATLFIDGKLYINEVSEGNPSDRNGIKPGDEIIQVNGITIKNKDRSEISQLLRGPKGTAVSLALLREGAVINKTIVREEIKMSNVSYAGMLADQIGYIRLDKFLDHAGQEVKDAVESIIKQKPKGLILDLRGNGGGILQEAVKIVNLFVEKNVMVVTQKGRNKQKSVTYRTANNPIAATVPIVVLINGTSASASEIVAGTLQDLDRAVVLGQRSYGKGLVQQAFNLPYNNLVKVTVAKYYTSAGRCIQALDYAHRQQDGGVEKFADSALKAFTTKGGRSVYDGNGVYPDLLVSAVKYSPITISLLNKSLFFDYANAYKKANATVVSAKSFQLSDADYSQFVRTLANKDYSYSSKSERLLNELKSTIEKENQSFNVKADLDALQTKISNAKQTDLITHKAEIKRALETQIISRYFYEKGKIEQSFQYDDEIAKAKAVLENQSQLQAILKGDGAYKTIGSPILKVN